MITKMVRMTVRMMSVKVKKMTIIMNKDGEDDDEDDECDDDSEGDDDGS